VQAARRGVPLVAFIEDLATGYGYNLACAADTIYCDPYSRVGNLGT
jgi:serine protease SohB